MSHGPSVTETLKTMACSGLLRQPKWGHLRDLHKAIKQAEPALVSGDPTIQSIGNYEKVGQIL